MKLSPSLFFEHTTISELSLHLARTYTDDISQLVVTKNISKSVVPSTKISVTDLDDHKELTPCLLETEPSKTGKKLETKPETGTRQHELPEPSEANQSSRKEKRNKQIRKAKLRKENSHEFR